MTTAADQHKMLQAERARIAAADAAFLAMVNDPDNPMTREDLVALIFRAPHRYARFAGWLEKLPTRAAVE